ncbi:MAG TPA: endonuclease [Verrucomicrobiae bacterium]|nr:endonuclease [Verrucomicrobiae bacterium]
MKLDRLMLAQGNRCFFCELPLTREEASIEHLHAVANGGSGALENCVACCKAMNSLLGNLPLKEKFKAFQNDEWKSHCSKANGQSHDGASSNGHSATVKLNADVEWVLADLQKRAGKLPGTVKKLSNTIAHTLGIEPSDPHATALVAELQRQRKITIHENQSLTYHLTPPREENSPAHKIVPMKCA